MNRRTVCIREASPIEMVSPEYTKPLNIVGVGEITLLVSFHCGKSKGCNLILEFSEDGTNWYGEVTFCPSEGWQLASQSNIRTLDHSQQSVIPITLHSSYMRIEITSIGSVEDTSLSILASMLEG